MKLLKLLLKGWLVKKFGMKLALGAFLLLILMVVFIVGMVFLVAG